MAEQLTSTKKWQLSIRLLLYSPLLFYVNVSETTWQSKAVIPAVPFFLGYTVVVLGMYFISSGYCLFFSEEKATFLITQEGLSLPVEYSLDQVAGMLNPSQFFRVNRQFLVARPAIQTIHAYSAGKLKLDLLPASRYEVFVSLSRMTEFKDWLGR